MGRFAMCNQENNSKTGATAPQSLFASTFIQANHCGSLLYRMCLSKNSQQVSRSLAFTGEIMRPMWLWVSVKRMERLNVFICVYSKAMVYLKRFITHSYSEAHLRIPDYFIVVPNNMILQMIYHLIFN